MKYIIRSGVGDQLESNNFDYVNDESKRPMALDVLLQAKATTAPDLAFRYGCRNELCGVCTIEVNGQPRLACRCRVSEGDELGPLTSLPHIRDLVSKRENVNKQLDKVAITSQPPVEGDPDLQASNLHRCIECYGCLSGCPMHEQNFAAGETKLEDEGFRYGNPYTLLKIRHAMMDSNRTEAECEGLLDKTIDLGLEHCLNCDGCKCQVGIGLVDEVIEPLLAEAAAHREGF